MSQAKLCAVTACASIAALAAGCASVAPLDDAHLGEVTLASSEDKARLLQAERQYAVETFGRSTIARGPYEEPTIFWPGNYDEYLAYIVDHPDSGLTPTSHVLFIPQAHKWPLLRLTFTSERQLFTEDDLMPTVDFNLCGKDKQNHSEELHGVGHARILWRDQIVYPPVSSDIAEALENGLKPQEYEIFFEYYYWDYEIDSSGTRWRMLLPLPDDLCASLYQQNWPLRPTEGRPLRIDQALVNAAAGPLPRPVPVR